MGIVFCESVRMLLYEERFRNVKRDMSSLVIRGSFKGIRVRESETMPSRNSSHANDLACSLFLVPVEPLVLDNIDIRAQVS